MSNIVQVQVLSWAPIPFSSPLLYSSWVKGRLAALAGIVVGLPLGIATGRFAWRVFATNFGVVPQPEALIVSVEHGKLPATTCGEGPVPTCIGAGRRAKT